MEKSIGKVYLVGAGPGDPGLITVKGLECVKTADVIVYDNLANERLLDQARRGAEYIYVGKESGKHTLPQDQINKLIIQKAKEGKMVVRLKGGDPFIFGRGGEEAEELVDHGIPFEVVPGVSAAIAVPAYAGIPLTHREHTASVAFVTGHEQPDKSESRVHWEHIAPGIGTLVIFMGAKNLPVIVSNLIRHGRSPQESVAVIQWGTRTDQKVVTGVLNDIAARVNEAKIGPPALIVVGGVTKLRQKLNWYESKPLFGKRILITHSRSQSELFAEKLTEFGATVIEFPTIDVALPSDHRELDMALQKIGSYETILFSSANAVHYFMERLKNFNKDIRVLNNLKICAVGSKANKALRDYGINADVLPAESKLDEIVAALAKQNIKGKKILLPRQKSGRPELAEKLRNFGADVAVVETYELLKPSVNVSRIKKLLAEKKIAVLSFTSSSSLHHFVEILGADYKTLIDGITIACIGPATMQTAKDYNMHVSIVPSESTIPAFINAIVEHYKK